MGVYAKSIMPQFETPVVQTISIGSTSIDVRRYHDSRYGFDLNFGPNGRKKVRLKELTDAVRAAERVCGLKSVGRLTDDLTFGRERPSAIKIWSVPTNPDEWSGYISQIVRSARKRAEKKGLSCSLTIAAIRNLAALQGWRCAVTGVPFERVTSGEFWRNPLGMSIDRIDNRSGYVMENCRLVLSCVNLAINEWGIDNFARMCRGFCACHG